MTKSKLHPTWYPKSQVLVDGKLLCLIGSTSPKLQIDIWLATHPFYTNSQVLVDTEGRVEKFLKKYQLNFNE